MDGFLYNPQRAAGTRTRRPPSAFMITTIRQAWQRGRAQLHRSPSPALEVFSVGYLENDSTLWWERTLYRGDQYEFHSRLGPIQSATPARGQFRKVEET